MRSLARLCVLVLLCAHPLRAQEAEPPALAPGERVRVSLLEGPRVAGQLLSLAYDSLFLQVGREPAPRVLPLASMQGLEVSRGRPRARWTLVGALSGATAGMLYMRVFVETDPRDFGGLQRTADGIGITLPGMLAGAALGWRVAPERWASVPLPTPIP